MALVWKIENFFCLRKILWKLHLYKMQCSCMMHDVNFFSNSLSVGYTFFFYLTAKKGFYGLGKVTQALHCSITMYQMVLQELRGNLLASKIVLIVRVDKSMSGFNMDPIQLSMRRPLLNFQQVTTTENAVTWNGWLWNPLINLLIRLFIQFTIQSLAHGLSQLILNLQTSLQDFWGKSVDTVSDL